LRKQNKKGELTLSPRTEASSKIMGNLVDNIQQVIVGKESVIRNLVLALAIGRHVLVEDVPGVGKTTLIKALARSTNLQFRRIQFTPDLLPADITGTSVLDSSTSEFRFREGPVFHNVILADEINRASPKTQSSLLECMQEGQVTVDGVSYPLPEPFLVMATQNPIEYEGTFPLPEAQLDRFALSLQMGYPTASQEEKMLRSRKTIDPLQQLKPVAGEEDVISLRCSIEQVHVSEAVLQYVVRITQATRQQDEIYLGASPRASLTLLKLAQALAVYQGESYLLPDHVKQMAPDVLRHRLILTPEARWQQDSPDEIIRSIINRLAVPGVEID